MEIAIVGQEQVGNGYCCATMVWYKKAVYKWFLLDCYENHTKFKVENFQIKTDEVKFTGVQLIHTWWFMPSLQKANAGLNEEHLFLMTGLTGLENVPVK